MMHKIITKEECLKKAAKCLAWETHVKTTEEDVEKYYHHGDSPEQVCHRFWMDVDKQTAN